jgi:hypothetical protein
MLANLSYWPWIIGTAASLAVVLTVSSIEPIQGIERSTILFGAGAIVTALAGLIEASMTGILVGEGASTIVNFLLGLALSIPGSIAAVVIVGCLKALIRKWQDPLGGRVTEW